MLKRSITLALALTLSLSLLLGAAPFGANPDEVVIRYPDGYTKVLVADLAKLTADPALAEGVLGGLAAARHSLSGIRQIVTDTLELSPQMVQYVAQGAGPGMTPMSLIQGLPQEPVVGALMGIRFASQAPGSPFKNWEMLNVNGLPVVQTGGTFGPVNIQWGYIPTPGALWVGTETSFGAPANVERLLESVNAVTARIQGQGAYFDELPVALAVRGGDVSFVRQTDPATDRPVVEGEQAMGFAIRFVSGGARVDFDVRFGSEAAAAAALAALREGQSPYLAQDLYEGALVDARRNGAELRFSVDTGLRGAVGLIALAIP